MPDDQSGKIRTTELFRIFRTHPCDFIHLLSADMKSGLGGIGRFSIFPNSESDALFTWPRGFDLSTLMFDSRSVISGRRWVRTRHCHLCSGLATMKLPNLPLHCLLTQLQEGPNCNSDFFRTRNACCRLSGFCGTPSGRSSVLWSSSHMRSNIDSNMDSCRTVPGRMNDSSLVLHRRPQ